MSAILVAEIFGALNFPQKHKNRQELFIIMTGGRSPYYVTKKKKACLQNPLSLNCLGI